MNRIFLLFLAFFARCIIVRHKPYIIGITGSVGKTTLSSYVAIYLRLLYGEEKVGISPYHYNGEYGLPLSIIGEKTGGRNPLRWMYIFLKAIWRCFRPYPHYLILEYGIDHPGEMEYLLSIARPDIAILSPVAPNHLEQFGTLDLYRREKLLLIQRTRSYAIVHESLREYVQEKAFFYGKENSSYAHISHTNQEIDGIDASFLVGKRGQNLALPSFGEYQVENILPVYIIADILQTDISLIEKNAGLFLPESGRSSLLNGIGESIIIDGSYNGGFESICRGIDSILPFLGKYRIILFLGDMRELGGESAQIHEKLAQYIDTHVRGKGDISLFLVGPLMAKYVAPYLVEKLPVMTSPSSEVLGETIKEKLQSDPKPTIIYVKGSQNTIFLEEGIRVFLRNPEDTSLLCRQSDVWLKKKKKFFQTKK